MDEGIEHRPKNLDVAGEPELRTASRDDVNQVLALWLDAEAQPTQTDDDESLTAMLDQDPEALVVASVDSRVVGSVIAGWDGWRGSVYRLVVDRGYRRRGLGSRFVRG